MKYIPPDHPDPPAGPPAPYPPAPVAPSDHRSPGPTVGGAPSLALLRHLRTKTTEELPKDVGGPALEVAISPAGDRIAVVPRWGFTREVVVWDVAGKKVLRRLALGARSRSAGFS